MSTFNLLPRLIRLRDAPDYLGMDRHIGIDLMRKYAQV
jgi:hypothetical protein